MALKSLADYMGPEEPGSEKRSRGLNRIHPDIEMPPVEETFRYPTIENTVVKESTRPPKKGQVKYSMLRPRDIFRDAGFSEKAIDAITEQNQDLITPVAIEEKEKLKNALGVFRFNHDPEKNELERHIAIRRDQAQEAQLPSAEGALNRWGLANTVSHEFGHSLQDSNRTESAFTAPGAEDKYWSNPAEVAARYFANAVASGSGQAFVSGNPMTMEQLMPNYSIIRNLVLQNTIKKFLDRNNQGIPTEDRVTKITPDVHKAIDFLDRSLPAGESNKALESMRTYQRYKALQPMFLKNVARDYIENDLNTGGRLLGGVLY